MVTEMKHQDPTKPMDSDRMATQMAQITSVEQLKKVGTAIEKLADKSSASDRLAMTAMIGKTVTVDKGRFSHQKGTLSPIGFDLPADAQKINLSVLNERGEEIASRDLEAMKAGPNTYNWDGLNSSNIQSVSGSYIVRLDAEDAKGNKIKIDPISQDTVVGISFDGGEANFLVGDAKNPQKVAFKNVIRIEGDATMRAAAQARQEKMFAAQQSSLAAQAQGNPAALNGLPTGLQEKMKSEQVARAEVANPNKNLESPNEKNPPVKAEGFPNGLGD
jgi:flagellar basal-body rod modification protein FlgD